MDAENKAAAAGGNSKPSGEVASGVEEESLSADGIAVGLATGKLFKGF